MWSLQAEREAACHCFYADPAQRRQEQSLFLTGIPLPKESCWLLPLPSCGPKMNQLSLLPCLQGVVLQQTNKRRRIVSTIAALLLLSPLAHLTMSHPFMMQLAYQRKNTWLMLQRHCHFQEWQPSPKQPPSLRPCPLSLSLSFVVEPQLQMPSPFADAVLLTPSPFTDAVPSMLSPFTDATPLILSSLTSAMLRLMPFFCVDNVLPSFAIFWC